MPRNGGTTALLAGSAVVVSILIALAAAHTSRLHKGAVSSEVLSEHVATARAERQDISLKIDHLEASMHSVETKQAVMSDTLERIYGEVKNIVKNQ